MTERFDLLQQVGKGAMGTVWRARERATGRVLAIKVIHPGLIDDPYLLARIEREVDVAMRIDSPYVVRVLGYGQQYGQPYIAMEFVAGQSLRDLIASGKTKDFSEFSRARSVLRQLALALDAAHKAGVIHRDVKPANVMVDAHGNVKLADFGISRALDMSRLTGGETILGTPAYMAPDGDATAQSDLYALGCVIFEMVTGTPPFTGETPQQVLLRHVREQPNLSLLPASLRPLVGWLLEKEPQKRPSSASALLERVDPPRVTPEDRPHVPTTTSPAGGRWLKRIALFAILSLVVTAGSWIALLTFTGPTPPLKVGEIAAWTPAPTPLPAPPPGPPEITNIEFTPHALPGGLVRVSVEFQDPDGDASAVHVKRISGARWDFGDEQIAPIAIPKFKQWVGEAKQELFYTCGEDGTFAELAFSIVDAQGGESQPMTARWECKE